MEINIEWRDGKWPTFNLSLATKEGKDPFIVIKGCGLMKGKNGEFVKFPSKKNEDNTYFNFNCFGICRFCTETTQNEYFSRFNY